MDATISKIINKALDGNLITDSELKKLFELDDWSEEAAMLRHASRIFSRDTFGQCEVSSQIGLDNYPCSADCKFCSFAPSNKVFDKGSVGKLDHADVVDRATYMVEQGATSIFIMTTVMYDFEELLEVVAKVRKAVGPDFPLVANTADFDLDQAKEMKKAGFDGAYHVIRMGEERDNRLTVAKRWQTIHAILDSGMYVSTCVEPIGPEHTVDELVEKTMFVREMNAVHAGAMRRALIPSSDLAKYGVISFTRLANIAAAINLSTGPEVAMEVHNPNMLGAMAGGNLFFAEVGANPRDTAAETSDGGGLGIAECMELFEECGCEVNRGKSRIFVHR